MFGRKKLAVLLVFVFAVAVFPNAFAVTATYSNIDSMSGWGHCTICAGGGEQAIYWMKQNVASPSRDGRGAQFFVGGTKPWSHGLWWKRLASDGTSTNFVFDFYYYIKEPAKSQGLEFATNQLKDNKWYKFSTQCNFANPEWRVWNSQYGGWVGTGIPCNRPPAYTWLHITLEYKRANGKAVFVAVTVNGKKSYFNKSFYPQAKTGTKSVGMHFQLNGDRNQQDYHVWADKMTVKTW